MRYINVAAAALCLSTGSLALPAVAAPAYSEETAALIRQKCSNQIAICKPIFDKCHVEAASKKRMAAATNWQDLLAEKQACIAKALRLSAGDQAEEYKQTKESAVDDVCLAASHPTECKQEAIKCVQQGSGGKWMADEPCESRARQAGKDAKGSKQPPANGGEDGIKKQTAERICQGAHDEAACTQEALKCMKKGFSSQFINAKTNWEADESCKSRARQAGAGHDANQSKTDDDEEEITRVLEERCTELGFGPDQDCVDEGRKCIQKDTAMSPNTPGKRPMGSKPTFLISKRCEKRMEDVVMNPPQEGESSEQAEE